MLKNNKAKERLLNGNPWSLMISLSLPAILGMVVIGLYNFMDGVFVGQMVGSEAMTAVKISYPYTLINSGIATLIGVGSASVLSRAIGKDDKETVDKIMGNLSTIVLILSLIVTVIGIIFTRQLLIIAGAEGRILELGVKYLRIIFCGSLFVNFAQSANMVMRGEGLLKKAMLIMGLGSLLNILLDPLMIYIMNKSGNGICGAAYATIISQIIQGMVTLLYFLKSSQNVKIHKLGIDKAISKKVLGVGISAMLMQVMTFIQQVVMYNATKNYGNENWQTILAASLAIQAFAFIPLWGMSQGFQPAVGTNYGAEKYDRVKQFMKVFCIGGTVLALLFYLPMMIAPRLLLSMSIPESNIVELGVGTFRLFFSTYISLGFLIMAITFFQSIGDGKKAAILTLLRQLVFIIPLIYILPKIGGLGVKGVFLAVALTDFIILIISIFMIISAFKKMGKKIESGN